jgi:hypothetical protein
LFRSIVLDLIGRITLGATGAQHEKA